MKSKHYAVNRAEMLFRTISLEKPILLYKNQAIPLRKWRFDDLIVRFPIKVKSFQVESL